MSVLLEVCVETEAGLVGAVAGGAGRIELCAGLALSGLTPSVGFMRRAADVDVPVHALIRPRAGDFCYGAEELAVIAADIAAAREAGLAGVVIGVSLADRAIDWEAMGRLMGVAGGMAVTLHRAFDLVPDREAALEAAISAGVGRVLTSGGAVSAVAGSGVIAGLVARAAGRIGVMAAGGITVGNVLDVVRATGVREVHSSCSSVLDEDADLVGLGFSAGRALRVEMVRGMVAGLAGAGA